MAFLPPGFLPHLAALENAANEEEAAHNYRVQRKRLRDACNPFDIPQAIFKQNFRLDKERAHGLIDKLTPLMQTQRAFSLTATQKVLTALKFLSCGSYQRGSIAHHNLINLSQASVSRCLSDFLTAMDQAVVREVIKFPTTEAEIQATKLGFFEKFGFPGCIGAVDCTLIGIKRPSQNEEQYYSHKNLHCINAQIICDSNLRITNINPRHGGATHDGYIWRFSVINNHLRNAHQNGQTYTWLVGDSGYPTLPWVMIPIIHADENTPEGRYTHAQIRTRNCVERVIGVMKAKWRCILKHRILHYEPEKARRIIRSCAALHNIVMTMEDYAHDAQNFEVDIDQEGEPAGPVNGILEDELAEGLVVRTELIAAHYG